MVAFVDCHTHAVPSDDDGAQTLDEARWLCRDAAEHSTSILFATPHVWPQLTLTESRERAVRTAYELLRAEVPLELRLGFELTPHPALLVEDLRRYVLEGTDCILIEVPFTSSARLLLEILERIESYGLRAVIAHPERTRVIQEEPELLDRLAGPGRLLQVNASSLLGHHGEVALELAWRLVEDGRASLVASDGHRPTRPARLDEVYELAAARVGEAAATPLFTGEALGLTTVLPAEAGFARRSHTARNARA
jgi:protein-tyrosine phosphatase